MSTLEFIAALIDTLAWPVCILGVVLILRHAYKQEQKRADARLREREARRQAGQG